MQEKDDKPKRGRKVVATPAAKAAPAASSEKRLLPKKPFLQKKRDQLKTIARMTKLQK